MTAGEQVAVVLVVFSALFVSSIAGYGGSLVLVPALTALLGAKQGVAFAALLLGWNNVFKVTAYRSTLALRAGWPLVAITAVGVVAGASILLSVGDAFVTWAVVGVVVAAAAAEFTGRPAVSVGRHAAIPLMGASAVLSGVSGSSGPLKGISIRALRLPRLEHVGLASCVSMVGDLLKAEVFREAGLLDDIVWPVLVAALAMMPLAAYVGLAINRRIDEEAFRWVFWSVVGAYTLRLVGVWW